MKLRDLPARIQRQITGQTSAPKSKPRGMNAWESAYAVNLRNLQAAGEILWFDFECWRLRIGKDAYYKPDFVVLWKDGRITFEEVKGHWREAAKVRIKVAAERYANFEFYVVKPDAGWSRVKV